MVLSWKSVLWANPLKAIAATIYLYIYIFSISASYKWSQVCSSLVVAILSAHRKVMKLSIFPQIFFSCRFPRLRVIINLVRCILTRPNQGEMTNHSCSWALRLCVRVFFGAFRRLCNIFGLAVIKRFEFHHHSSAAAKHCVQIKWTKMKKHIHRRPGQIVWYATFWPLMSGHWAVGTEQS